MYMCWHKCSCDVCPRTHGRITECEDRARILEQNSQLSWIQVLCDVNVSRILEAKEWEFQRWLNSHAWLKTLWSGQAPWTISLWIISKGNHKNYHCHHITSLSSYHIIVIISHHCHHCFFSLKKYSFRTVRLGWGQRWAFDWGENNRFSNKSKEEGAEAIGVWTSSPSLAWSQLSPSLWDLVTL